MVSWAATVRWPTRASFWAESLEGQHADLQLKYETLTHWIAQPAGIARDRGLRSLAARWPGALREGQLASVEDLRQRAAAAAIGGSAAEMRDRGDGAVPLWGALHGLLGDLVALRGPRPAPDQAAVGLGAEGAARWPSDPAWWSAIAWPPDSRLARAWLSAVSGIEAIDAALGRRPG